MKNGRSKLGEAQLGVMRKYKTRYSRILACRTIKPALDEIWNRT